MYDDLVDHQSGISDGMTHVQNWVCLKIGYRPQWPSGSETMMNYSLVFMLPPKKTMELQTCTNKCSSRKNVQKGQTTTCWQNVQIQPNVQTSSFRWLAVKNLDHLVATTVTFCAQFGANERNFKEYPSWVCQPFQPTFKLRAPSCETRSNLAAAQKFRKCAHFHISKRTESCVRVMYEVCIYI